MDTTDPFKPTYPAPTSLRPLLGLTVLVIEDSRYACEAMRLLCLRSGARIRRADTMRAARRHLQVYRPSVAIVDLGLPDGNGADLIRELVSAVQRPDVILGISGDADSEARALEAGADGFMEKPVVSLANFQEAILTHLPEDRQPLGPRALPDGEVQPDPIAYRDDMVHVADVLEDAQDVRALDYVVQFLGGVARSAQDLELLQATDALAAKRARGDAAASETAVIAGLVQDRLSEKIAI
ncbi:response regulator [Tateyamaria sp. ANG-S1]|uniref:response regulator n=1 Tax=Tateyamaria sp. ANG-S1 TaxID=1577905 RepID=UPI00057EBE32|nr:response regulator [Tateyamaria sp. ANG-S1]KIC50050.1 response regulator [Tateyamaria sp. ANG-S1]